jgi:hypothetical protein
MRRKNALKTRTSTCTVIWAAFLVTPRYDSGGYKKRAFVDQLHYLIISMRSQLDIQIVLLLVLPETAAPRRAHYIPCICGLDTSTTYIQHIFRQAHIPSAAHHDPGGRQLGLLYTHMSTRKVSVSRADYPFWRHHYGLKVNENQIGLAAAGAAW